MPVSTLAVRLFVVWCASILLTSGDALAQSSPTWSTRDVGAVAAAGLAKSVNDIYTVGGSGADIWGTADEFRFVYQTLSGDGSIVARVTALDNVDAWTKAGVMMRESLKPNSRHAFMLVSSGHGMAFQRRTKASGSSSHTAGGKGTYLKLTRKASTFSAYASGDGTTWTKVGSAVIAMAETIHVGLAVTSHVDGAVANAQFEEVSVTAAAATRMPVVAPPPAVAAGGTAKSLRVLHWNTQHGRGTDNKYNIERIADWIVKTNPDVVSLNEVEKKVGAHGNEDQPARYAAMLKARTGRTWYYHFAQRYGKWSANGQGNLILSRFPIDATASLGLTCDRSAALATINVNGRAIAVVSTHLANDSSSCRTAQASAIKKWVAGFGSLRIIAGDWNATQQRSEYTTMTAAYADAWAAAKASNDAVDFAGNTRDGATHSYRIDYVFHTKSPSLTLEKAQVFNTKGSNGARASDHKPLLVTYSVK